MHHHRTFRDARRARSTAHFEERDATRTPSARRVDRRCRARPRSQRVDHRRRARPRRLVESSGDGGDRPFCIALARLLASTKKRLLLSTIVVINLHANRGRRRRATLVRLGQLATAHGLSEDGTARSHFRDDRDGVGVGMRVISKRERYRAARATRLFT